MHGNWIQPQCKQKEVGKTESQVQAKGKSKTLEPLNMGDPVLVQDLRAKKNARIYRYLGQLSDRLVGN